MPQVETTATLSRESYGIPLSIPVVFDGEAILTPEQSAWASGQVATVTINAFGALVRRQLAAEDAKRAEAHKAKTYEGPMDEKGKHPAPATVPDLKGVDWQAEFDTIFADYELKPSTRGTGSGSKAATDPVSSLARSLAEMDLIARIQLSGKTTVAALRKVVMPDGRRKFTHFVDQQFASKQDEYMARAKARHEEALMNAEAGEEFSLD